MSETTRPPRADRTTRAFMAIGVFLVLIMVASILFIAQQTTSARAESRLAVRVAGQSQADADAATRAVEEANRRLRAAGKPTVSVPSQTAVPIPPVPGAGPQGPPGIQGIEGEPGPPGKDATGAPGQDGQDGQDGGEGPAGPPGADSTVPGPSGPTGPPGADSTVPGPQGSTGSTGETGGTGPQGPPGDTGAPGRDGSNGTDGRNGRGVLKIECLESGDWRITYSDDTTDRIDGPCRVITPTPSETPTDEPTEPPTPTEEATP